MDIFDDNEKLSRPLIMKAENSQDSHKGNKEIKNNIHFKYPYRPLRNSSIYGVDDVWNTIITNEKSIFDTKNNWLFKEKPKSLVYISDKEKAKFSYEGQLEIYKQDFKIPEEQTFDFEDPDSIPTISLNPNYPKSAFLEYCDSLISLKDYEIDDHRVFSYCLNIYK